MEFLPRNAENPAIHPVCTYPRIAFISLAASIASSVANAAPPAATASSAAASTVPTGACDGDRFGIEPAHLWRGRDGEISWWWQIDFGSARPIGAILQIHGDHAFVLRSAPRDWGGYNPGGRDVAPSKP